MRFLTFSYSRSSLIEIIESHAAYFLDDNIISLVFSSLKYNLNNDSVTKFLHTKSFVVVLFVNGIIWIELQPIYVTVGVVVPFVNGIICISAAIDPVDGLVVVPFVNGIICIKTQIFDTAIRVVVPFINGIICIIC